MVESDFQREYQINLVQALPSMTARRFFTLLRGLGPNSAAASRAYIRKYGSSGAGQRSSVDSTPAITDPKVAQARFVSLFAPPRAKIEKP